jgi:4a-hydroxytetrahydrobiopterin dehydratase
MNPSSPARRPVSRALARNAALANLLATPGLGSLIGRRWFAGTGQLILAVAGFTLILVWFFKEIIPYYRLMFSDTPPQVAGYKMLVEGAILFAAAWLWSAVTSFSLLREAAQARVESLKQMAEPAKKLDEAQIAVALAAIPDWQRNGDVIARAFQFKDFPAAVKFVNAIAVAAEEAWHHPDIDIRWNKVTLTLTTHDAGGLTEKDFELARKFDALSLR